MINPLIISRLIEAGYMVFIPIDGERTFVIEEKQAFDCSELKKCIALNASRDGKNNPFIKIEGINSTIACVDKTTRTVWLLPSVCERPGKILRLGKNYERYIVPEPTSLSYQEQKEMRKIVSFDLHEKAIEAVNRMHEQKGMNDDRETRTS